MKHLAIYCTNTINKNQLIKAIQANFLSPIFYALDALHGNVYSSITIDRMIKEESIHGSVVVTSDANATLESMSSGQQQVALADYIFNQNPDYVIIDELNSNVDIDTLSTLHQVFEHNAHKCIYIQLFSRFDDVLPYISKVIELDGFMKFEEVFSKKEFLYRQTDKPQVSNFKYPELLNDITYFETLIDLRNVTVAYGAITVLNKINWKIKAGEFWELRGPIGSGKSTLLSMIVGDNPKAYGQDMYLFGIKKGSGESVWDIKKQIGYFYPKMMQFFTRKTSVADMILSGYFDSIGLYVQPLDSQHKSAQKWIEILGKDYRNKRFDELSSGQQRIVLVIRAIIKQPPLLILDEPTVGLDEYNSRLFVSMLRSIAQLKKIAIVFVSHRKEVGLQADRILELTPSENGSTSKIIN